jgi:hypothetical protein
MSGTIEGLFRESSVECDRCVSQKLERLYSDDSSNFISLWKATWPMISAILCLPIKQKLSDIFKPKQSSIFL